MMYLTEMHGNCPYGFTGCGMEDIGQSRKFGRRYFRRINKVPQKVDFCFGSLIIKCSFARTITEPVLAGVHRNSPRKLPGIDDSCHTKEFVSIAELYLCW